MKAVDLGLSVFWGESLLEIPQNQYKERLFTWGDVSHYYSLRDVLNKFNCDYEELVRNNFDEVINYDYNELINNDIISKTGHLTPFYDHAHKFLGKQWRMPTVEELQELINKCEWQWIGDGYVVTGPNKNSIKLPYEVSYNDTGQRIIEDIWYEGEVEKKVFSREIRSFWSSEPSYDYIQDGMVNQAYVLFLSSPDSNLDIHIFSEDRSKKNLIIPVTNDKTLVKENNFISTKPNVRRPSFIAANAWIGDYDDDQFMDIVPPPIVPNGEKISLPLWNKLSDKAKSFLNEKWGVNNENEYNKLLNDMTEVDILEHALKNFGLI